MSKLAISKHYSATIFNINRRYVRDRGPVENTVRVYLDDDEFFEAIEQVRPDSGLEIGSYAELSRKSHVGR